MANERRSTFRPSTVDGHPTPSTRYYGSKYKLLDWIASHLERLEFDTVLDVFGGSACVSHMFKRRGKQVTCNDLLRCNYLTALGLIENNATTLRPATIDRLLRVDRRRRYDNVIARTFDGIYFLPDENRWLDAVCQNIAAMRDRFARALAYHALFQSALVKRPFNLFHRRNLYLRTAQVTRGFGNKTTWDRPFEECFRRFVAEANAAVFDNGTPCRAMNQDALHLEGHYDLVYVDPPYINGHGQGVDYHGFYHFLEGMTDYANWPGRIDYESKHRRLQPITSPWTDPKHVAGALRQLFERFADSILAMSYRSDGVPSRTELIRIMKRIKPRVHVHTPSQRYQYVLSTNRHSTELLLIGTG